MPKTQSQPQISDGNYEVKKVNELNFFDLSGSKAKTKGTSNKMYHAELQVEKDGSKAQIFTMYGPTGSVQKKEWRWFDDVAVAEKEYEKILKSKRKKGYKDIDVAQRSLGSNGAKQITKSVELKNAEHLKKETKSLLTPGQRRLVEIYFGSQAQFVAETLKCPLGQLTNNQIDDGRACLDTAKNIVNAAQKKKNGLSKLDKEKLLDVTNDFYGLIPHNLGAGARGQLTNLLLDDLTKIMKKEDDLDTLLDAKIVGAKLNENNTLDAKYKTLSADIEEVEAGTKLFNFLSSYFLETKVDMHGFKSSKVKSIWKVRRHGEWEIFESNASQIAEECGKHTFFDETKKLSNFRSSKWIPKKRPDLDKKELELLESSNTWLCWHGTRSANLAGITTRGLLVRPSGAIHTGSMFGDGKYYAWQSTKSLNYCDGGYYTGGKVKKNARFMFLLDVALGNLHLAKCSRFYKKPPDGCHSVYGKAHYSGVYNDEMITYDFNSKDSQSRIRYLFEIID